MKIKDPLTDKMVDETTLQMPSGEYISERFTLGADGEISNEVLKRFQPAVFPMDRVHVTNTLLLKALKTRAMGITKGNIYRMEYVYRTGQVVVRDQKGKLMPGLYMMDAFCEMLEVPNEPQQPTAGS